MATNVTQLRPQDAADGGSVSPSGPKASPRPASQTLDRGLRVLEHITEAAAPLTVADVAREVGMHRSITYRMLRTLEAHGLIARDGAGRYLPAAGLAVLAGRVTPTLRAVAAPQLQRLAVGSGMTAFLVVRHDHEAVTVDVVEPLATTAHVSYRPGIRHPLVLGAPGLALLAGEPPTPAERAEVRRCRTRGWAVSEGEVIEGYRSVAAPIVDRVGVCRAALAVVFAGTVDLDRLGASVAEHARAVGDQL